MIHRKRSTQTHPIDMDAMVDVVFLLLVFFLFSFQLNVQEAWFRTNLAIPGQTTTQSESETPFLVWVTRDSSTNELKIRFNDRTFSSPTRLRAEIDSMSVADVLVVAGPGIPYGEVVSTASVFREAGWDIALK